MTDPAAAARRAYGHGRRGEQLPDELKGDADYRRAYEAGSKAAGGDDATGGDDPADPTPSRRPAAGGKSSGSWLGAPTLTPPRRLSVHDGSGFLFGMLAYALVLNGIRYGTPGVRGWLSAKFLNKPYKPGGGA